jgi:RNA polymerase primary sigma factor
MDIESISSPDPPLFNEQPVAEDSRRRWQIPGKRRRNYWKQIDPNSLVPYRRSEPLPYLKESRLLQQAQRGDLAARNEIWVRYARLVLSVVNELYVPRRLLADAIQEGICGLHQAIDDFDVESYRDFSSCAWQHARRQIQRFLFSNAFFVHIPSNLFYAYCRFQNELHRCPTRHEISACEGQWQKTAPDQYRTLAQIHRIATVESLARSADQIPSRSANGPVLERSEVIESALRGLTERELTILAKRYGLNDSRPSTLEEIGDDLGLTRASVCRIQASIEEGLRVRLSPRFSQESGDSGTESSDGLSQ